MFAAEIRTRRIDGMKCYSNWRWHLEEVFVTINGERHYLWQAVDHEGEVPEGFVTKRRDKMAAHKLIRKVMKVIGNATKQETGRWKNNRAENYQVLFRR